MKIEVNHITKNFNDFTAVDDVSFTIERGISVGLVGESGCGKSTMASLIAGLEPVDEGSITLDGKALQDMTRQERKDYHRKVQMVFQDSVAALNPRWTAGASISEPMDNLLDLSRAERKMRAKDLLEQVGLSRADYKKRPRQFSGGQRQRIAIARALAIQPDFLLLDEVTSSLDVSIQAQILNLLIDLKEKHHMGFLLISHDLGVVRYMCDQILIMYQGRLVEKIMTDDLEHVKHPYSKLLLSSVPSIYHHMSTPESLVVDETDKTDQGCAFYDRCPLRQPHCLEAVPPLEKKAVNHEVACFEVPTNT